jgi:hypothetical protein
MPFAGAGESPRFSESPAAWLAFDLTERKDYHESTR